MDKLAMFYGDKPNNGQYDNGVWLDILGIPYLQKIEEASLYETVIRTLWLDAIGWTKEIRDRYPHVTQIGLNDHPLSTHISRLDAVRQHAYLADLQFLDGLLTLTEEERQFYQTALPHIPVERGGLPFPIESYEKQYGNLRSNEKQFIGLGVGAADNDRNFVSNILAFRKLQLSNPDLVGVFLSIPDQLMPYCTYWAERVDNVFIHQRNGMGEFYEILSQCKFVINLADRNTPGRIQGEGAFFEVPIIGSDRLELQGELYPELTTSPFSIETVVALGQTLLDKPEWASALAKKAHGILEKEYNYEISKQRFERLLNRVGENK